MIIGASFMIVATVAALAISSRTRKKHGHEPESHGDTEERSCDRREEEVEEVEGARLLAKDLRKRKSALEKRLLELHDAKEEYWLMVNLRRRLNAKCSEVESLERKVRELWADRNVLEGELRKSANGVEELRSARSVIMGLQERIDSRKKGMGEMVKTVEERVDVIRRNDGRCNEGARIGREEDDAVNDVKMEVLELQRTNKELECERRELTSKLDDAQVKIRGLSRRIENGRETMVELKKEAGSLRRANEELRKRVDQLQKKRFSVVEELVYTRWLNICLRFEADDFYSVSRKNPTDSSHCNYRREWSTKYIEKTGRILRAVSIGSDSSQTSTESRGIGGNSAAEGSSSSSENKKKHRNLIHRIKHWGRGKKNSNGDSPLQSNENTTEGGRRIRRYSTSMIPERLATTTESSDTPKGLSRLRRVSFNDTVRNSDPLFESTTMATKTTAVAEEHNISTPATETTEPQQQNISAENSASHTSGHADTSRHEQNLDQEMIREVSEVGAVEVATGAKIGEVSMVIVFLIFILIITLYYRIF